MELAGVLGGTRILEKLAGILEDETIIRTRWSIGRFI